MESARTFVFSAAFIAAGSGFIFNQRSLLLTDAYKFPYPLISCVTGLVLAFFVSVALFILLRIPWLPTSRLDDDITLLVDEAPSDSASDAQDIPYHSGRSSFSQDSEEIGLRSLSPFPRSTRTAEQPAPSRSYCLCGPSRALTSSLFSPRIQFGLALALRLAVGGVFFSHASFATLTAFALATLPVTLIFADHGETARSAILGLCEVLAVCLVVIPRTRFPSVFTVVYGILFIAADVILLQTAWRALRSPWHRHSQPFSLLASWRSSRSRHDAMDAFLQEARRASVAMTVASFVALFAIVPLLLMSGELQDVSRNCYVLGENHFWGRIGGTSATVFAVLLAFALVARTRGPASMACMQATLYSVLLAIIYHSRLGVTDWINLAVCWSLFLFRTICRETDAASMPKAGLKTWRSYRKTLGVVVLYLSIYFASVALQSSGHSHTFDIAVVSDSKQSEVLPGAPTSEQSTSLIVASNHEDSYMGARLDSDTNLDWRALMFECADSEDGLGVEDITRCLRFLSSDQDEYMNVTESSGLVSSLFSKIGKHRVSHEPKRSPIVAKMDECDGKIFTYHSYWTGKATWRVELFIKAFLYTQNLPCSRLWIWLDEDRDPDVLKRMEYLDTHFERFRDLLKQGYISLKPWRIPEKISLPRTEANQASVNVSEFATTARLENDVAADRVIADDNGDLWLVLDETYKEISTPTQISDLVRFVVLHMHGGVYLDMDVLLLRDLRPLLLPNPNSPYPDRQPAWAEQWVERADNAGNYNTAVLSLPANSSISSYLLRGGRRMGMNYHPRVLGLMLWKDGWSDGLAVFHNAIFDPLVTNLRRKKTSVCTVPCHKNFQSAFMGEVEEPENEWSNYHMDVLKTDNSAGPNGSSIVDVEAPPNRTLANFFHGAFAYHIHNQWNKFPEAGSWMDVITQAQDGFFDGSRTNAYGEVWGGPLLEGYDRSEWLVKH